MKKLSKELTPVSQTTSLEFQVIYTAHKHPCGLAWFGYQLKDGPAHCRDNASFYTDIVRRTARRQHFCCVFISVAVQSWM